MQSNERTSLPVFHRATNAFPAYALDLSARPDAPLRVAYGSFHSTAAHGRNRVQVAEAMVDSGSLAGIEGYSLPVALPSSPGASRPLNVDTSAGFSTLSSGADYMTSYAGNPHNAVQIGSPLTPSGFFPPLSNAAAAMLSPNPSGQTQNLTMHRMVSIGYAEVDYPCTRLRFAPVGANGIPLGADTSGTSGTSGGDSRVPDLFATSSDRLILWDVLPQDAASSAMVIPEEEGGLNNGNGGGWSPSGANLTSSFGQPRKYSGGPKSAPIRMNMDLDNNISGRNQVRNQHSTHNNINDRKHLTTEDGTQLQQQRVRARAKLQNSRRGANASNGNNNVSAPITSFDWCRTDPNTIVTSSVDTTCTVWDLTQQQPKTQLIAHDKEVFDVAFRTRESNVFASVGADGSLRIFDLRDLEHSTIIYEVPFNLPSGENGTARGAAAAAGAGGGGLGSGSSLSHSQSRSGVRPLLRLNWNEFDSHYIATFQADSNQILILDIRVPGVTVLELTGHKPGSSVTSVEWSPHSRTILGSTGTDSRALIWDVSATGVNGSSTSAKGATPTIGSSTGGASGTNVEPISFFEAEMPTHINSLAWSRTRADQIALTYDAFVQCIRI